ncbi:MAG: putative baseplate assembly protein [Anaerolineales bacterium]|nr:putative baseplate assembly protein [Anaerolineales bacterium]
MSDILDTSLDTCGCCAADPAPEPVYNRPGLPALAYRRGTYATILRRMLRQIGLFTLQDGNFAGTRPLAALTTRQLDDASLALLDAGAVVADVLTFYQERIANEGFLRTATERRSILEMARAIGYELSPGVAAATTLAFTVEDALGAPGVAEIPAGTRVQSIPPQGKLPQTFETGVKITARKEWNALRPRSLQPQDLTLGVNEIYLSGMDSGLHAGDVVIVSSSIYHDAAHVTAVAFDQARKLTRVSLDRTTSSLGGVPGASSVVIWGDQRIPFDATAIRQEILDKTWQDSDLGAFLQANQWDPWALVAYLQEYRSNNPEVVGQAYRLKTRLGIFGDNAPMYTSLPVSQRFGEWAYTDPLHSYTKEFKAAAYPYSWEDRYIHTDSQGTALGGDRFYLNRSVPAVSAGGFVVLKNAAGFGVYPITAVSETSLSDYGMSAKVTGLTVTVPFDAPALTSYKVRETTAYVESEKLAPAEKPLTAGLAAGTTEIELDGFFFGLQVGGAVLLTGERSDARGQIHSEVLTIKAIVHDHGLTSLTFTSGPQYPYLRETVSLNANSVRATHGETVREVLGSGDGARAHQRFTLKKPPLTYVAAATPGGSASTLQLRLNNLLWQEAASLYGLGPNDQQYIARNDDDGKTHIQIGDGLRGARLPTGEENVTAVYRSGIGLEGQVQAGSLTLLPSRPLGVRGVTNPLAASGADDPETMRTARQNAPLTVRTLDRIVSRQDYEDFASAFAGVGKAQAVDLWSGEHHLVHVTIAGADGQPVTDEKFFENFIDALDAVRDPSQLVRVDTFDRLTFDLSANVAVDDRYLSEAVFSEVRTALEQAFSFEQRSFGQPVTAARVVTEIQKVAGVVYVDLDSLYLAGTSIVLDPILASRVAHVSAGLILRAQLLLINPLGISLQEVQE